MGREEQIVQERLKKLVALREEGVDPYPQEFEKTHDTDYVNQFSSLKPGQAAGEHMQTAGRVMLKRDMGKIAFLTIQDWKGNLQLVFQKGETPEKVFPLMKKLDVGDIIGVEGHIIRTQRGELSLQVQGLQLLSKSLQPLPEKWHGITDKEERYRKRYLDMIMHPEVRDTFLLRSKIVSVLRDLLREEGFVEIETPTLQGVYGGASAQPFMTHLNALDIDLYLSISPELYLKRLVVGGVEKVYTICKNFRNEGIDATHNPEFTMMEYYAAYKTYEYHMRFTEKLFYQLIKELNLPEKIRVGGEEISLKPPFKQVAFRDLLKKEIAIDINQEDTFEKLAAAIKKKKLKGVEISGCSHYGALLDELYKRVVRPNIIQPTFLTHYPVEMIALAKRNKKDPKKINSVQLLVNGAEMMKAYDELNDPLDQEARLNEQAALLKKGDGEAMPMDEDFIAALKLGMPPTAGYGMGIDRLVMLLAEQESIRDVIPFPFMRPEDAPKKQVKKKSSGKKKEKK